MKVDLDGKVVDPGTTDLGVPYTGFVIHSAIHTARKDIKCIIHVHTGAGIAVGAMKCGLLPLSLEAASPSVSNILIHIALMGRIVVEIIAQSLLFVL